jgi:hypothetical protein
MKRSHAGISGEMGKSLYGSGAICFLKSELSEASLFQIQIDWRLEALLVKPSSPLVLGS